MPSTRRSSPQIFSINSASWIPSTQIRLALAVCARVGPIVDRARRCESKRRVAVPLTGDQLDRLAIVEQYARVRLELVEIAVLVAKDDALAGRESRDNPETRDGR